MNEFASVFWGWKFDLPLFSTMPIRFRAAKVLLICPVFVGVRLLVVENKVFFQPGILAVRLIYCLGTVKLILLALWLVLLANDSPVTLLQVLEWHGMPEVWALNVVRLEVAEALLPDAIILTGLSTALDAQNAALNLHGRDQRICRVIRVSLRCTRTTTGVQLKRIERF